MIKKEFLFIIILSLTSCAHWKKTQDYEVTSSVIDLAKSSYLKGCIDGMNSIQQKFTRGVRLEKCKKLSIKHEWDLKDMLNPQQE
ncbi:MAG: hypothetical protein CME66_03395 [Halobacteriovoraceae bacterium]|nr:hypothetical protein [Halobacteriovoraceae bacterium]